MTAIRTALVIGGGIAGPVTAMALHRAGIEATVYEAHETTADGVGGALSIAPNGQDAFAAIGVDDILRRIGTPVTAMVMRSWTGKRLAEFGSPPELAPTRLVWRGDLYRELREAAADRGIRIAHGKRLTGAEQDTDGVTARFADGTTASADILIGADGIRSTVRTLIDPAAPRPRYAGLLGFGARVDETGLPDTDGRMQMVFGRRAFFGYQVLDDGSGGWFANLPHPRPMSTTQARALGPEHWQRVLAEAFADDRSPAAHLVRRLDPADLLITGGLEDIPTVPTWHRGRLVLVGDAAHATSPSSGQGASLAAESAVQLARCLRDLPARVPAAGYEPPEAAFAAYERLRRDRVERIIRMAARTNSDKAAGPVARVLRDLLMPVAMRFARPQQWAWQLTHRIDWAAPVDVPAVDAVR